MSLFYSYNIYCYEPPCWRVPTASAQFVSMARYKEEYTDAPTGIIEMLVCLSHQLNISLENKHFIPNKVRRSWRGSCLVFLCNYRAWLPLDFTGMVFSNPVGLFHSYVSTFKQTNKQKHLVRIQIMLGQGNPDWICYQYPSQKQTNK